MSDDSDEKDPGERLPALVDEEGMRAYCRKVGWLDAPIFEPLENFSHWTYRMADTWIMMGVRIAMETKPHVAARRGRPRKLRTRGLLTSNDIDEMRAYYVHAARQSLAVEATDAEIINGFRGEGKFAADLAEHYFIRLARPLFANATIESLRNSVSTGRRKRRRGSVGQSNQGQKAKPSKTSK